MAVVWKVETVSDYPRLLRRSVANRAIAGVCGGLALQFGVPTAVVRLAFVLMTLFAGGIGLVIYAVLWVVMPIDGWTDD